MDYLPSKKFGITAVLILAAFAGWFFIFGPGKSRVSTSETQSTDALISVTGATSTEPLSGTTPTEDNERYLRLEGISFLPSRLETSDETASSTVAGKKYGLELVKSLALYGTASRLNEVQLVLSALEKGNATKARAELLGLKASVEANASVRESLSKQKVPESFKVLHAALITSVSRIEQLSQNMENPFADPVLAVASAEGYRGESQALKEILGAINDRFAAQGITFSEKEKATVVLYEVQ